MYTGLIEAARGHSIKLKADDSKSLMIRQRVNIEFDYLARVIAHQIQIYGKLN